MGLFERFFGSKTERIVRTSSGDRMRLGSDGLPRYSGGQRLAIELAIDIRGTLTSADLRRPYGPGNGLEVDLERLRAVAPTAGAVEEIQVVLMTIVGTFIGSGRYTRDNLLEIMGLKPNGSLVQPEIAVPHPALQSFCQFMSDLFVQAVGLGGNGGPAVDEYSQQQYRVEQVGAWLAQAHARLDLQGTTSLPSRNALTRT